VERKAPTTFAASKDAGAWLTIVHSEIIKGEWVAPEAGEIFPSAYVGRSIAKRKLRPRTRVVYESLWKLHIKPFLGGLGPAEIRPATVRAWRASLLRQGRSDGMAVRSYALLRTIHNTAVKHDEILSKNPCRTPGFDQWTVPERLTATVTQVDALASVVPARFRALVVCGGVPWPSLVRAGWPSLAGR